MSAIFIQLKIETHNSSIIDIRKGSVRNDLEHVLCIKLVIEA